MKSANFATKNMLSQTLKDMRRSELGILLS